MSEPQKTELVSQPAKAHRDAADHADGLSNVISGFGGQQDATTANFYSMEYFRPDPELSSIWISGGLGRKICSCRPDDMLRQWISFPDDTDGKMLAALDAIDIRTHLKDLLAWTELYRGAIMVLGGLDTSAKLEVPARISKASKVSWIKVYPAPRILNTISDLVLDANSPYYEDYAMFRVLRLGTIEGQGGTFEVHRTRCIVSKGISVPKDNTAMIPYTYLYWGMSRLQAVFNELANNDTASKAFANLLKEATIAVAKIQGLRDIMANEDTAQADFDKIMESMARAKSVLNMRIMADGDEFTRDSLNTTGWREVKQMFREELAAVAEIPVPRLFGIPSPGLGSGGADEQATATYYDSIHADQEIKLRPIIAHIVKIMAPGLGLPEDLAFVFNPLQAPSEKEVVEIRKTTAETDKIYEEMGVVSNQEIRDSRFGGTSYSRETKLDPSLSSDDFEPAPPPAPPIIPGMPKVPAVPVPAKSKDK